jgi:hypothetical protein
LTSRSLSSAIGEGQLDVGETEDAARTPRDDVGQAVHGPLDRNTDLLLHLFGGMARKLGDEYHLGVRRVGIGFDLQLLEGPEAQRRGADGEDDD